MTETAIKVDSKIPLAVILAMCVAISGTYAHTQQQLALTSKLAEDNKEAINNINDAISGIAVSNYKLEALERQVSSLGNVIDRVDRRLAQNEDMKLR